jgi:hypothetical protein
MHRRRRAFQKRTGTNNLLGKWGIAVEKQLGMDTLLSKRSVCPVLDTCGEVEKE